MQATKNDLSFDLVKLDYDALLLTAKIAWRGAMVEVERNLKEIQNWEKKSVKLNAQWLAEAAKSLQIAIETCEALEGAKTRSQVKLINLPEVKE